MRVIIIQERIPDYRVPFFEGLRADLESRGIPLQILCGAGSGPEGALKKDEGVLPWAGRRRMFRFAVRGVRLTYLAGFVPTRECDVLVVEHANRHLLTYLLLLRRALGRGPSILWWGHGANLQAPATFSGGLGEAWKRWVTRRADGALAYTEGSKERFVEAGLREADIVTLNNSVDTSWADGLEDPPIGAMTCATIGALYDHKRVDLLLAAADLLSASVPGFELRILGDGPDCPKVIEAAASRPWLTAYGRVNDAKKAELLSDCVLILNPGLVGLVAVDSLAASRPIVFCANSRHSPEVEYLVPGYNSVSVFVEDARGFAEAVARVLLEQNELLRLREGCRESRDEYSLKGMVERFSVGVRSSVRRDLTAPPRS